MSDSEEKNKGLHPFKANAEFFREWIHVPHYKRCWATGYCEACKQEFIECGGTAEQYGDAYK